MQPNGEEDATITYYESEEAYKKKQAKGQILINKQASLESTTQFESKGHSFAIAIKATAPGEKEPVVTVRPAPLESVRWSEYHDSKTQCGATHVPPKPRAFESNPWQYLAATTFIELERWKAAFNRALRSFHRPPGKVMVLSKEEKKLATQPLDKLQSTLRYMGVSFDEKTTDTTRLAFLIMREKEAKEEERLAALKKNEGKKFKVKKRVEGAKSALMRKIKREQQNLLERSVDELLQLLEFMDIEVEDEWADKPEVLANLIINQRYFSQVSKHIEPFIKNWAKRAVKRVRDRKEEVELS